MRKFLSLGLILCRDAGLVITQNLIGTEIRYDWTTCATQRDPGEIASQRTLPPGLLKSLVPFRDCYPNRYSQRLAGQVSEFTREEFCLAVFNTDRHFSTCHEIYHDV